MTTGAKTKECNSFGYNYIGGGELQCYNRGITQLFRVSKWISEVDFQRSSEPYFLDCPISGCPKAACTVRTP
jgi:hypothetical protein